MELQVEFGLGLGLQRGEAPEKLNLPLAVDSAGAWSGGQSVLAPRCAQTWSISNQPSTPGSGESEVWVKARFSLNPTTHPEHP